MILKIFLTFVFARQPNVCDVNIHPQEAQASRCLADV